MKTIRSILFCGLCAVALGLTGCHSHGARGEAEIASAAAWTRSELFFGQSMPGGALIPAADWQRFVDEQITPAFSDGLTIVDAGGQYKNRTGTVIKEPAKIVILVYRSSAEKDAAIRRLVDDYKRQFKQESVLWTSEKVEARF
jgi:hypothetical protein